VRDFSDDGLRRIINRDIDEFNGVSDNDLLSIYSFFKFLIADVDDLAFLTPDNTIVAKYRDVLGKKGFKIIFMDELDGDDYEAV
jgi:hypothetical protein